MGSQVHRVGMNLISVLPYQWSLLCISYIQSLMETDWLLWLSSAPLSHDPKKQISMSDWKQTLSEFWTTISLAFVPQNKELSWVWLAFQIKKWSRKWQPTPVFLPRKFHGQRSQAGYSPRGRKGSDMTERLSTQTNKETGFGFNELDKSTLFTFIPTPEKIQNNLS